MRQIQKAEQRRRSASRLKLQGPQLALRKEAKEEKRREPKPKTKAK